jgi:hypothetical protein
MKDKFRKLGNKQSDLLYAAGRCAKNYISQVPMVDDFEQCRLTDFVAGYLKAMKDCGYDITNEATLSNIVIEGDA